MNVTEQLLSVVHGELRWTELPIGLVEKRGGQEWFFPATDFSPIVLDAKDITQGIKALAMHTEELRAWAAFILAASSLLSFEKFDESEEGEVLLETLWDIAFGVPLENIDLPRPNKG